MACAGECQNFLEGGGNTAQLRSRCREAFTKLFRKCRFDKMPRVYAVGSRGSAFDRFKTAHNGAGSTDYVAMLIDSEDRVADIEQPWDHLRRRDRWSRHAGATDDQVLLMVTSMETWIVADRDALRERFGSSLNENRLPPLDDLESRGRDDAFNALKRATGNGYEKGRVSFELVGRLDPSTLQQHLPSFHRARRILDEKLSS